MSAGILEAVITVPTGGWAMSLTVTAIGGPTTATVAAGSYTLATLMAAVQTALDGAFGPDGAFTVSASTTDKTGTGIVTIAHAVQTFSLTWTATNLRDALGFTGNLTPAAASFVATSANQLTWHPDCDHDTMYGSEQGHYETDRSETIAPDGTVTSLVYASTRRKNPGIKWSHITRPRARIAGETTPNQSFERWWLNTHAGTLSYFGTSPKVRWYPDAATLGTYFQLYLTGRTSTEMARSDAAWIYLWPIEVTGYMAV